MSIVDKLDKKISDKKNKQKLIEEERDSLFKKIYDFGEKVYKKNIANDFIKLKKLFEKHIEKDDKATVNISISWPWSLEIKQTFLGNSTSSVKIELVHNDIIGRSILLYRLKSIKELKSYKFLDTNFNLLVSSSGSTSEEFEFKNKEKAYENLNDLFQKEILCLGEKSDEILQRLQRSSKK